MNIRSIPIILVAAATLFAGCSSLQSKASKKAGLKDSAAAGATAAAPAGPDADVQEASLRAKVYENAAELKAVHFALDSARFSEQALAIMKANAEWLNANATTAVLIEGHADDRGTIAYNLALGQERAQAVKEYYKSLGIPLRRMSTISYGELKPVCEKEDEECWGQNRRAETKIGTADAK